MTINYDEKRNFMRMATDTKLSYREVGSEKSASGDCINLSADGILFKCKERFQPGALLEINISPKLAVVKPLDATVQVVRTELDPDGDFKIACEIKTITS